MQFTLSQRNRIAFGGLRWCVDVIILVCTCRNRHYVSLLYCLPRCQCHCCRCSQQIHRCTCNQTNGWHFERLSFMEMNKGFASGRGACNLICIMLLCSQGMLNRKVCECRMIVTNVWRSCYCCWLYAYSTASKLLTSLATFAPTSSEFWFRVVSSSFVVMPSPFLLTPSLPPRCFVFTHYVQCRQSYRKTKSKTILQLGCVFFLNFLLILIIF